MNSLKKVLKWLQFNKRRSFRNQIFEIPFHREKTTPISIPNIQNKSFKISKWYVKVGDYIREGQILCELESNSITVEFESFISGKLVMISNSRKKLNVNDLLCRIENA